jgi:PAS domain S-box-containing protein
MSLVRTERDVSEHARAVQALRESEERFRALVTATSDVVYRMSPDWSEMRQLRGRAFIPDTDLPSHGWLERYIPADERARVMATISEAIRTRTTFELEHRVLRVDGTEGWTFSRAIPLLDEKGDVVEWFGAASDITARKRAEEALRGSEERFRLLVQGIQDYAIYMLAPDGTVSSWSAAAERMFGYREQEVIGRHRSIFYTDDERAIRRPQKDLEEAAAAGRHEEEAWRVRKDGSRFWANVILTVLHDDAGMLRGYANVTRDFTEQKRAEEELKAKKAELETILDRTPFMLTRCGRDLRYRYVSRAYAEMIGRTPQDIAGRPIVEIMGEEGLGTIRPHVEAVLRGQLVEYEEEVNFPGVGGRVLDVIYVPDSDERGQVTGWIANMVDVTERRQAEALRAANAQLLETDRLRSEFLAKLSHELRNPLAPIRNSLYILDHVAPGGEQATRAKSILHRQVGQLTWLIDDLLDITRITHGKVLLQRERLDLNELAQRTAEDHRTAFVKSAVRLEVLPSSAEVWVNGDRVRLTQVIGNLLQNAAKFTPRGGKTTVSVEADAAQGQAILTVQDTGSGIEPEMLPRLFQVFAQADATLDRSKGGLGLGLALVKGLIELHGGAVSVSSEGLGKGATFTIRLPLDASARHAREHHGAGGGAFARRVLVIEDNADAAESLRDVLELEEHVVEVAYGGREGVEKARAFHPDVVLCDIGLPEMDGYAVARAMRADARLGRIGLVALSGYTQPEDVAAAKEAGFDAHLAKPPSVEKLGLALEEAATRRQSDRHDE